jgi:hypothetical protein
MSQYTSQIIEGYICGLAFRSVEVKEIVLVAELSRGDSVEDPVLDALANYVAYLCRYHLVSKVRKISMWLCLLERSARTCWTLLKTGRFGLLHGTGGRRFIDGSWRRARKPYCVKVNLDAKGK